MISTEMAGEILGPFVRDYTFRDLELFALGCGAGIDGKDGLEYISKHDERDLHLKVLPTFGATLIVDFEVIRTIDYGYNYAGPLHWGFGITLHEPITKMNDHLETMVRPEGFYGRDEGRGLLAQHIGGTHDPDGNLLFTNESWDCLIYDGGWGGPKPLKNIVEMPDHPADAEITETIPENRVLIYRLSGDYHLRHIDWDCAAENGEPCPTLHAISYAGTAMRYATNAFVPGESGRITRFETHITSPVHPGATLKTRLWKIKGGELRPALVDTDADKTDAKSHLNWGIAEYC